MTEDELAVPRANRRIADRLRAELATVTCDLTVEDVIRRAEEMSVGSYGEAPETIDVPEGWEHVGYRCTGEKLDGTQDGCLIQIHEMTPAGDGLMLGPNHHASWEPVFRRIPTPEGETAEAIVRTLAARHEPIGRDGICMLCGKGSGPHAPPCAWQRAVVWVARAERER
jgi:hypothetical protein